MTMLCGALLIAGIVSFSAGHFVAQKSQTGITGANNFFKKDGLRPLAEPRAESNNLFQEQPRNRGSSGVSGVGGGYGYAKVDAQQSRKTTPRPSPKPRPDMSARKDVIWFPEYHGYSLRASVDNRFRIKHAPIPADGSPWPMPQFYSSERARFYINPFNFTFSAAGESCDVLEYGIERVQRNMFGVLDGGGDSTRYLKRLPHNETVFNLVNVTVLQPCDVFPHLDMDETCKSSG